MRSGSCKKPLRNNDTLSSPPPPRVGKFGVVGRDETRRLAALALDHKTAARDGRRDSRLALTDAKALTTGSLLSSLGIASLPNHRPRPPMMPMHRPKNPTCGQRDQREIAFNRFASLEPAHETTEKAIDIPCRRVRSCAMGKFAFPNDASEPSQEGVQVTGERLRRGPSFRQAGICPRALTRDAIPLTLASLSGLPVTWNSAKAPATSVWPAIDSGHHMTAHVIQAWRTICIPASHSRQR